MNYENIINFLKKNLFNILLVIIIIIMTGIILFNLFLFSKIDNKNKIITEENIEEETEEIIDSYRVEIKGLVKNPGVYEATEKERVIDIINKAGGLEEGANTELLNLAKKITDEMVIIIYSNDFINNYKESKQKIEYVYIEVENCPDKINQACINNYENNSSNDKENNNSNNVQKEQNDKVSLNKATKEQLMTLKGIGEAKAIDIINYRNDNNGFKTIDDILNVKGIGNSVFEKIKENITV